jgi:hypothetical protein
MTGAPESADATYFIRPFVQLGGGGLIDGLDENGATQGSVNFTSDATAAVDLDDGTARAFLDITGPNILGQAGGIFGETVTFNNAVGTTADFSFDFDGNLVTSGVNPMGSILQIGVSAALRVFESGSGADYTNFLSHAGALVSDSVTLDFTDPLVDLDEVVDEILSGSLTVAANTSYDVFASLVVFTSTNLNPVNVVMDFDNTGTFGIDTAPGVTYTSASGVFLGATGVTVTQVPEPAMMSLFGIGIAGIAVLRRRRTDISVRSRPA